MDKTCATCRFFLKQEAQHIYGDCHRQPPQFSFYANFHEPTGYGSKLGRIDIQRDRGGVWPNISQDDWCGEWQAAGGKHD